MLEQIRSGHAWACSIVNPSIGMSIALFIGEDGETTALFIQLGIGRIVAIQLIPPNSFAKIIQYDGEKPKVHKTALLAQIEEAGEAVMILTEGLEKSEFIRSRLTRVVAERQVCVISDLAARLSPQTRNILAEPDWAGWEATRKQLALAGEEADEALWFAVTSLVPATLMWLRVYRENQPKLFICEPEQVG
jgi:uncharacterized protein with HEPN domain